MEQYDLELNILSCLICEPKLMEQIKLEDKHFAKHQLLWQFMKAFYRKYQTFDLVLMYNVCKDKYSIVSYIESLAEAPAMPFMFDKYQDQLIEQYNQDKVDKWLTNQIYQMATSLYIGNISIEDFETRFFKAMEDREIYKNRPKQADTDVFK